MIDDRYKPLKIRGSGAMGDVWTADDTKLGRTVALKFLASERLSRKGLATELAQWPVDTFKREALAMARVNHRNVAQIYDSGEHNGTLYIVMEFIEGGSLADRLKAGEGPTLEQTVRWTGHICHGLGAAHLAEVIHRDIKPSNIMINDQGDAKIVDFGLARFSDASHSHIGAGTPLYKAPERWKGDSGTVRSDLYSLGCVMYEMLTGRPPFGARNHDMHAVMRMHLDDRPVPPSAHRPGIPRELDEIVLNLLEKEQAQRPGSAQAVAQAVELVEYSPAAEIGGRPGDASDRLLPPYVNADFVRQIREVERRIIELDRKLGPWDQSVVAARTELAELTGKSGDARGAAALYDRLGQDCRHYFGPYDVRVLDAFEGVARWIGRPGGP
ncbi:serine/threonine-protein kinase [Streptomyces sp. NPDC056257]|uniref:serine/threonine-protein kinase n=1 Tax=Streptomyces sp. NPDC056257 TaxID=3345765 RepID=UPI0035D586B7